MINILKGNMFSGDFKVSLSCLLEKIPPNKWDWYIYEIYAVGIAPQGMDMHDFEKQVLSSETGLKLTWDEVRELSNSLTDIDTCYLAALSRPVKYDSLEAGDLTHCFALITIFDSTTWEIKLIN